MSLKDFLRDTLGLGRDDVFKVDVKEGFSFFNTDAEHTNVVLETLNNMHYEGRRINVEVSKNEGGGGRRDHNGRSGGGRSGGNSFGGRSESFGGRAPRGEGAPRRDSNSSGSRPPRRSDSAPSRDKRPRRS